MRAGGILVEPGPAEAPALGHQFGRDPLWHQDRDLSRTLGPNGSLPILADPIGTRLMDSTPPATAMSQAGHDARRGELHRLLA